MQVALHEANAARIYHPGVGAVAPPPKPAGMSVWNVSPALPVTRHLRPSTRLAVAGGFLTLPFSGCSARTHETLSGTARIGVLDIDASSTLIPATANVAWNRLLGANLRINGAAGALDQCMLAGQALEE